MGETEFGGPWTKEKLSRLGKYLTAYMTALKNKPFEKLYVDAFAGTGYWHPAGNSKDEVQLPGLQGIRELARGSARIALEVSPPFDRYVFIEKDRHSFRELIRLGDEYPSLKERIRFENVDANDALADLCKSTAWRQTRAVAFLDPYGAQVNWHTIETIASTQRIDLWYLFPVGALIRMLTRRQPPPEEWSARLDLLLGNTEWRRLFYTKNPTGDLFDNPSQMIRSVDTEGVEKYLRERLSAIFRGGVGRHALALSNRKGACMFLLFFACGNPNPRASALALRIANHILRRKS
jgi:three-Cys-motif partner protein